jgi:hypothetical protein
MNVFTMLRTATSGAQRQRLYDMNVGQLVLSHYRRWPGRGVWIGRYLEISTTYLPPYSYPIFVNSTKVSGV